MLKLLSVDGIKKKNTTHSGKSFY